MTRPPALHIFGEVLFDHFPTGEQSLGGAPFNVAWHLQALGDEPHLITRVGDDPPGRAIREAMATWGMDVSGVQTDPHHPTGLVTVTITDGEPHYRIVPDCAYDFIADGPDRPDRGDILYHGTLGIRNATSRETLARLRRENGLDIFLDVNLRTPWWQGEEVCSWLKGARWVKLNQDELQQLGFGGTDIAAAVADFQKRFDLDQVILTRGELGAMVRLADGMFHLADPEPAAQVVDTVGAGDAFSAVYLHGLRAGWPAPACLDAARRFASRVVGLRGATTTDPVFYTTIVANLCRSK